MQVYPRHWLHVSNGANASRENSPICRLFIIDGAKALRKVIRRTFGAHTPIQRCQIHKARNVIERLPKPLHASVRRAFRQAWELDDTDKAERLLRNLARRIDREAPSVAASGRCPLSWCLMSGLPVADMACKFYLFFIRSNSDEPSIS